MKTGSILIVGGLTMGAMTFAGHAAAVGSKPAQEKTQECSEAEKEAIHQYLLERGLLEMEEIFFNSCSDFNRIEGFQTRIEPETPTPETEK